MSAEIEPIRAELEVVADADAIEAVAVDPPEPPRTIHGTVLGTRTAQRRPVLPAARHFYASALIRHGESVKVVQRRLGHSSAAVTLDTYAHLWPDSDDRTREAVEAALTAPADPARTGGPAHGS